MQLVYFSNCHYPLVTKHSYGKSPFLICKSTINHLFSIAILNYQRVSGGLLYMYQSNDDPCERGMDIYIYTYIYIYILIGLGKESPIGPLQLCFGIQTIKVEPTKKLVSLRESNLATGNPKKNGDWSRKTCKKNASRCPVRHVCQRVFWGYNKGIGRSTSSKHGRIIKHHQTDVFFAGILQKWRSSSHGDRRLPKVLANYLCKICL